MIRMMTLGVLLLLLCACSQGDDAAPGPLMNTAVAATQSPISPGGPVKRCMNLGNGLDAPYEGAWTYRIEDDHITEIALAGFDTIRLPIRWDVRTLEQPPYTIDPVFLERVDQIVDLALSQGLQIILDMHHYEALYADPVGQEMRFLSMWSQISQHYSDYPESVLFEVINEPVDELNNDRLEGLFPRVLDIIRRDNPDRWVILTGDNWGSIEGLLDVELPEDDRTIWTYHLYHPHEFTHQGAPWSNVKRTGVNWGNRRQYAELTKIAQTAAAYGASNEKPMLLGEFGSYGAEGKAPRSSRLAWLTHMRKTHEHYNIGWCAWDFGAAFAFYDVNEKRWDEELLSTLLED